MEESYETFELELGPPKPEAAPQKPVRPIHRPEMYTSRKKKEEPAPVVQQQPQQAPNTQPRDPSFPARNMSLRKSMSIQNLTQTETPWENVTLNRCLFVAITILVLTSGFQRLHETLRGRRAIEEEEAGVTVRRSGALRHRGQPPKPETSLWEVMFWWLPDFDDDDDDDDNDDEDDDDGEVKQGKSKRAVRERTSRLRNRPHPDKKLTKQREGKCKDRRAKRDENEEIKEKKREMEKQSKHREEEEMEEDEDEEEAEEVIPKKKKAH